MSNDAGQHVRRSIRLHGYNYAQDGAYFVTICVQHRLRLFGNVVGSAVVPNEAGCMIEDWWCKLPHTFPSVATDAYVIMPNHIHGIVIIGKRDANDEHVEDGHMGPPLRIENDDEHRVGADPRVYPQRNTFDHNDTPSLSTIIQWFKTMTTNAYIHGVREHGWPPFAGKLWQRSYYERAVRNEHELNNTRDYVNTNPLRWNIHQ